MARLELQKRLAAEKDPLVRQDLEILIAQADRDIRRSEANERNLLPYDDVAGTIFFGMKSLLDDQVDAPNAVLPRWFACASTPAWSPAISRSRCRPKSVFARS